MALRIGIQPCVERAVDFITPDGVEHSDAEPSVESRFAGDVMRARAGKRKREDSTASEEEAAKRIKGEQAEHWRTCVASYFQAEQQLRAVVEMLDALQTQQSLGIQSISIAPRRHGEQVHEATIGFSSIKRQYRDSANAVLGAANRLRSHVTKKKDYTQHLLRMRRKWRVVQYAPQRQKGAPARKAALFVDVGIGSGRADGRDARFIEVRKSDGELECWAAASLLNWRTTIRVEEDGSKCFRDGASANDTAVATTCFGASYVPSLVGASSVMTQLHNALRSIHANALYKRIAAAANGNRACAVAVVEQHITVKTSVRARIHIALEQHRPDEDVASSSDGDHCSDGTRDERQAMEVDSEETVTDENKKAGEADEVMDARSKCPHRHHHRHPPSVATPATAVDVVGSCVYVAMHSNEELWRHIDPSIVSLSARLLRHLLFKRELDRALGRIRVGFAGTLSVMWLPTRSLLTSCAQVTSTVSPLSTFIMVYDDEATVGTVMANTRIESVSELCDLFLFRLSVGLLNHLRKVALSVDSSLHPVSSLLSLSIANARGPGVGVEIEAVPTSFSIALRVHVVEQRNGRTAVPVKWHKVAGWTNEDKLTSLLLAPSISEWL